MNTDSTDGHEVLYRHILAGGQYTTLALTDGNESYALSLHYALDPEEDILYFLSDKGGVKLDFFRSDPFVCGTVILQEGISFSSVIFRGLVEVVHKPEQQERILALLRARDLPFRLFPEEEGKTRMFLKLVIDEISERTLS